MKTFYNKNAVFRERDRLGNISFLLLSVIKVEERRNYCLSCDDIVYVLVSTLDIDGIDSLEVRASCSVILDVLKEIIVIQRKECG